MYSQHVNITITKVPLVETHDRIERDEPVEPGVTPDTESHEEVTPRPEPAREPFDPHLPPLDNEDDARYLDPMDARRREVEFKRGERFDD